MQLRECSRVAAAFAVLVLLTACAVSRPWTETRFEAASRAAADGKFNVAYDHLDSLAEYGDASVRAEAVARIKSDPRILAAGPKVIFSTLEVNAASLDIADLESETRFKSSIMRKHAAVNGTIGRYKALVPSFNEDAVIHAVYEQTLVWNAKRLADEQWKQRLDAEGRAARQQLLDRLAKAELQAQYECSDKRQCDKAFSLAQIFISTKADMKIQVATDTVIETYNPTDLGKIGMKVIRMPKKGDSAAVILTIGCKEGTEVIECAERKIGTYEAFVPFVSGDH